MATDADLEAAVALFEQLSEQVGVLYGNSNAAGGGDDIMDSSMHEDTSTVVTPSFRDIPEPKPEWARQLTERFSPALEKGRVLHRPAILADLLSTVRTQFDSDIEAGVMVKGPQGIGKSHTLVDLCLHLAEQKGSDRYHVTLIPDCDKWRSINNFVVAVFGSFGLELTVRQLGLVGRAFVDSVTATHLLDCFDKKLAAMGMKWIFIFDQVNALFARKNAKEDFTELEDVHKLPFPYDLIPAVRKPKRIVSIICASANNEISHRDRHREFKDFDHPIKLTEDEARLVFESIPSNQLENFMLETGGIALQLRRRSEMNEDDYRLEERDAIQNSVSKFRSQQNNFNEELFKEGIVQTLLKSPTTSPIYDRKYFVDYPQAGKHRYEPLFPLVEEVYMHSFWDEVMTYIADNERRLLAVCADPSVDQGSRGRHFELIVIRRCVKVAFDVTLGDDTVVNIDNHVTRFAGNALPPPSEINEYGVWIPTNPGFPAIDLVVYCKDRIIGVQVHIWAHKDTVAAFEGMCRVQNWHTTARFKKIEMWYLSPGTEARAQVSSFCGQRRCRGLRGGEDWYIDVKAITIADVTCLADLPWPSNHSS